ncbi:hypothetical protein HKX48_008200 [Thoreauomyces humboldtii]|nr:hypothetical protein HKX48_008200 [Thoreauomyces humboldtii]
MLSIKAPSNAQSQPSPRPARPTFALVRSKSFLSRETGQASSLDLAYGKGDRPLSKQLVSTASVASRAIKYVYLQKNGLEELPDELRLLISIVHLDVSFNRLSLEHLQAGVFEDLLQLQFFAAQDNCIVRVPNEIGACHQLEHLNLHKNRIVDLPPGLFAGLENLRTLDLGANDLVSLPEELFHHCLALQELRIASNQIAELSPLIKNLSQLTLLDASRNRLTALPSEIATLQLLQSFAASDNRISSIPYSVLGGLTALEDLALDGNPIASLPEMKSLTALRSLNVERTLLTVISPALRQLTELSEPSATVRLPPRGLPVGPASPKACVCTGDGLTSGVAGRILSFTIAPHDVFGSPIIGGEDLRFRVHLSRWDGHLPSSSTSSSSDRFKWAVSRGLGRESGIYTVNYSLVASGTYDLRVTLTSSDPSQGDGKGTGAGAMKDDVVVERTILIVPGPAAAAQCTASLSNGFEAPLGEKVQFLVQARDSAGNATNEGGDELSATLCGEEGQVVVATVLDNRDGQYTISYLLPTPGRWVLEIKMLSPSKAAHQIRSSPLTVFASDSLARKDDSESELQKVNDRLAKELRRMTEVCRQLTERVGEASKGPPGLRTRSAPGTLSSGARGEVAADLSIFLERGD